MSKKWSRTAWFLGLSTLFFMPHSASANPFLPGAAFVKNPLLFFLIIPFVLCEAGIFKLFFTHISYKQWLKGVVQQNAFTLTMGIPIGYFLFLYNPITLLECILFALFLIFMGRLQREFEQSWYPHVDKNKMRKAWFIVYVISYGATTGLIFGLLS